MQTIKATRTRTKGDKWCRLEVELRDGRLSICGSEGYILKRPAAKREALEYWTSYFEENRAELDAMNDRLGTNYRTAKGAARYVLSVDGDFHGLDVDHESDNGVFVTSGCGQIVESLAEWFPEVVPYLPYHLNDMKAGSPIQEAWLKANPIPKEEYAHKSHYDVASAKLAAAGLNPDANGYKYGSAWLKEELPPEVIAWAESLRIAA